MSRPMSFKESLVTWRSMADRVADRLDEMPHLRENQEALLALVERSEELLALGKLYESKLREVNRAKVVAFGEGRELRNRLANGLRHALGDHDPKLIGYGVPPRPREQRRNRPTKAERERRAAAAEPGPSGDRPAVN
jgi:hypothetical protein